MPPERRMAGFVPTVTLPASSFTTRRAVAQRRWRPRTAPRKRQCAIVGLSQRSDAERIRDEGFVEPDFEEVSSSSSRVRTEDASGELAGDEGKSGRLTSQHSPGGDRGSERLSSLPHEENSRDFAAHVDTSRDRKSRTSRRDPHVAAQGAYAAHLQATAQQPPDPTAAVWRRQNSLLVECAEEQGVDAAVDLLWDIHDEGRAVSQNFNQVVSLLAGKGRLNDGLDLAVEAGKLSFANIITFRPLMKLCCSSGDGRAAKHVWRAMVDCGVDGDMFLYAEFMGALVRSQDIASAERVIESLLETGRRPHVVLYNTLLKGLAKQANVSRAFEVLQKLLDAGVSPDETTFNTLLNTCVRAKDLSALNEAMALMREHGVKPGVPTFNTLLKLYARAGRFEDALEIFHEMQETVEPSIVTFNTLIDGCAHRGDMERAATFFDEMIERGMEPDICTMTSLLKGFGRSNNPRRAVELYEAMQDGGYEIEERTRYAVINACLRAQDRINAKRLMSEMLEANLKIRMRTWVWMLETDIWCEDEDAAIATLRDMTASGTGLDVRAKSAVLREARDRGGFMRFQRELKATRAVGNADRRRTRN